MRAIAFSVLGITSANLGYGLGSPIFWALMGCGIAIAMATELECDRKHEEMEVD